MIEHRLDLLNARGASEVCVVEQISSPGHHLLRIRATQVPSLEFVSQEDFEDCLLQLRSTLDAAGLLLLCNRFCRDAFVTSLSRQMSLGLTCYRVRPKQPVSPEYLVPCLGPAPATFVCSAVESDDFIEKWKTDPPSILRRRFPGRGQ